MDPALHRLPRQAHPTEMGAPEVTKFLTSRAVDGQVVASTQNQALSALLFLYKDCWKSPVDRMFGP